MFTQPPEMLFCKSFLNNSMIRNAGGGLDDVQTLTISLAEPPCCETNSHTQIAERPSAK